MYLYCKTLFFMNIWPLDQGRFMHIRPHMLGIFTNAFAFLMLVQHLSISVNMFTGLEDETGFSFTKNVCGVGHNPAQRGCKMSVTKVLLLPGN